MSTEFNYDRAHREWALPQWRELPQDVKDLYVLLQASYGSRGQNGEIEQCFAAIDGKVLRHALQVIFALGHWDSHDVSLEFPRDTHGGYWKFEQLAKKSLISRGLNGGSRWDDELATVVTLFQDHKEGTDLDDDELTRLAKLILSESFEVRKVMHANHRVKGRTNITPHPFYIGNAHFRHNATGVITGREAPCAICQFDLDQHISDRILVLRFKVPPEGEKLNAARVAALKLYEPFILEHKLDGIAFVK